MSDDKPTPPLPRRDEPEGELVVRLVERRSPDQEIAWRSPWRDLLAPAEPESRE